LVFHARSTDFFKDYCNRPSAKYDNHSTKYDNHSTKYDNHPSAGTCADATKVIEWVTRGRLKLATSTVFV
jgi:hypothetical protein